MRWGDSSGCTPGTSTWKECRSRLSDGLSRRRFELSLQVLDRSREALVQLDRGLVTELVLRPCDVRERVTEVPGSRLSALRLDLPAGDLSQLFQEGVQRDGGRARDVEC
jgi:hypothetical protein